MVLVMQSEKRKGKIGPTLGLQGLINNIQTSDSYATKHETIFYAFMQLKIKIFASKFIYAFKTFFMQLYLLIKILSIFIRIWLFLLILFKINIILDNT